MAAPRLYVRCFARDDDGLVDEWPVVLDDAALGAAVPALSDARGRASIHEIPPEAAARLAGVALGPYPEPVIFFVEPETLPPAE